MILNRTKYRFLLAGGGTGGHIFPAIAVAENIRQFLPEAEILFIGTKHKIEAEAVPKAGFKFKSIWIKGFARKFNFQNLLFPVKVIVSIIQSLWINISFKPKVAIGSGGYVAGPALWTANLIGTKIMLLEQNSYPGVTTRLLEKKASEIHVCFENSLKYLREKEKVHVTGNPVRIGLTQINRIDALKVFGFNKDHKTILILGGSLGAASINSAVADCINSFIPEGVQVIWQTGELYYERYKELRNESIWINSFIDNMSAAFSACDLCISRAGATTIAEVMNLGVATIFVPSPNVAANHQYYNAKALAENRAAILLKDSELKENLFDTIINVLFNEDELKLLQSNIKKFAKPNAASEIAKRAIKLAESL